MCTELIRPRASDGQGGSKNCAISSRHRVRPNQAVSRLNGQTAGSRPSRRASTSAPGSGKSRISREHSSARLRNRGSCGRGSPVHQRIIGSSDSSSGRTAPGSRLTAFGPARSTIRSEQTCGRPGAGRWHSAETSAAIRRPGSSDPRSTIARQGNRAMTVSSTSPSGSHAPAGHSTTRFASAIRVTCGFSTSGPPACSAAGPQSFDSSVSTRPRSTGIPAPPGTSRSSRRFEPSPSPLRGGAGKVKSGPGRPARPVQPSVHHVRGAPIIAEITRTIMIPAIADPECSGLDSAPLLR